MPLTYLIDEHLRGDFPEALVTAGLLQGFVIDVLQIGDEVAPPLGTQDPQLLLWCQSHERILISRDVKTLPEHLAAHLNAGHSSPGIILIRAANSWHDVLEDLTLIAVAYAPEEMQDQIRFVPL